MLCVMGVARGKARLSAYKFYIYIYLILSYLIIDLLLWQLCQL